MACIEAGDKSRTILVVSENGYGKRTPIDEYRITHRGGKGIKTIQVTEKTGSLVGILDVSETEDLMITCESGVTIRTPVSDIRELGRATQGVKLIRLDDDDRIAAITSLDETRMDSPAPESGEQTPPDEIAPSAPSESGNEDIS
jgi:DNA gyrase subunit A